MTLSRGEGENIRQISQVMDFRHKIRDFIRAEGILQDRLKVNQAQDLRIRDLQANFKVYTEKIEVLMSEIKTLPDDVKKYFRKAKREYQKLKHDFSDVFIFTSSDQLTMRPTYYLTPRLPDLERSARNANEDRLRDAVNQISPFHQELSRRVQAEQPKVARDQLQQETTKSQVLAQRNGDLRREVLDLRREVLDLRQQKEIQESRPQDEEKLKKLQSAVDSLVDSLVDEHIKKWVEETNEILAQLPGVLEHLAEGSIKLGLDSEKERELGLDANSIDRMNYYEQLSNIADLPIPEKIKYIEERLKKGLNEENNRLDEENNQVETRSKRKAEINQRKEEIRENLEMADKHQRYLALLQKTLQEQYEKLGITVEKYKGKRNELRNLPNLPNLRAELERKDQDYVTFFKEEEPLSHELKNFLRKQAVKRYKAELDPKAVSPLLLHEANLLAEQASETVFDETIARMQELQKRAAEDLGLEDYDHVFFLKPQRYETDYYSRHGGLICLKQGMRTGECGIICVQMVAADKHQDYSEKWDKVEKMLESFEHFYPTPEKGLNPIIYAMVLKEIGHPIEYQYCRNRNRWPYPSRFSKMYSDYMGHDPQNITVDQLRSAIEEREGTIIVDLERIRTDKDPGSALHYRGHSILIDAMVTSKGEEYIIYRDPAIGKGCCVSWKDFLEVWGGTASVPVRE